MDQTIPLNKLTISEHNVRKTYDDAADEQLSFNIEAVGQLQNLLVHKTKKRGHFAVIAGGRRLRAMNMIVERGAWQGDHGVRCLLLEGNDQENSETSLAENFHRANMSPAEECTAFKCFINNDTDIAGVAKRFGVTKRFVEGRLRLANLAEPIFQALADGKITLELAQAYASTENHDIQLRVYESNKYSYNGGNPEGIRRMIGDGSVRGDSPKALLIGEEAYTQAGGHIDRDLFSEVAEDRWLDTEIVNQLVDTRMQEEATRLLGETGLGSIWPVAGTSCWNAQQDYNLKTVKLPPAPISEESQARIDEIDKRIDEIVDALDALDEPNEESEALNTEYDALSDELKGLSNPPSELPDDWKSEVGKFLILTTEGQMVLSSDYYSEKSLQMERDDDGNITGGLIENTSSISSSGAISKPSVPEATAPDGSGFSARLFDELSIQRRNILAAALLGRPDLALDFAIFALADGVANMCSSESGTTLQAPCPNDPIAGHDMPEGNAEAMLNNARDELNRTWAGHKSTIERFDAFRALNDDVKAAWLAYAVGRSFEAKAGYSSRYNPIHAHLGALMQIDPATYWRPTSANFFDRIKKGAMLSLLKEVGGADLSARYAGSKKMDISQSCEKLFAGDAIVEEDIKERALAWVPSAMRFSIDEPDIQDPSIDDEGNGEEPNNDDLDDLDEDDISNTDPDVNDELNADAEAAGA